jgi:hypothetical protein
MKKVIFLLILLFPISGICQQSLKKKADQAWAQRDDPQKAMLAFLLYDKLARDNTDDIDAKIMTARAGYWVLEIDEILAGLGERPRMSKNEQVKIADKGISACRKILKTDDKHMEASYWVIWNMAARTLAKGIFSGFAFRDSIVGTIMVSKADVTYQYGGIYRYWARIIHEMPGLLGKFFHFTDNDAVKLYKEAIEIEPAYLRNHFWLAETYEKMDLKKMAVSEYKFCIEQKDGALPELDPENRLYNKWAAKRLEEL